MGNKKRCKCVETGDKSIVDNCEDCKNKCNGDFVCTDDLKICKCKDNNDIHLIDSCDDCRSKCDSDNYTCSDARKYSKYIFEIIIIIVIIQIILLIFIMWLTTSVLKKCKGQPGWLNPTVIIIIVLWFLLGWWIPGLGFLFFIILLTILLVYNYKCDIKQTQTTIETNDDIMKDNNLVLI